MRKYRIIEKITINNKKKESFFFLERKKFWGWEEVLNKEDINEKNIHFNDFLTAENYLLNNYLYNWGYTLVNNNIYSFYSYSYSI